MNIQAPPRPARVFDVMRDAALESGGTPCDEEGCPYTLEYCRVQRVAELRHRAPEEWELERVVPDVVLTGFAAWLPDLLGADLFRDGVGSLGRVSSINVNSGTMTITAPPDNFFGVDRSAQTRFTQTHSWSPPPRFRAKPSRVPASLQKTRMDGRRG